MSRLCYPIVLGVIAILFVSCGSSEVLKPDDEAFPPRFTMIRDRILIPRCVNCHSAVVSHNLLLNAGKSMVVPGDAEASKLYTSVVNGDMPQYGEKLSDEEVRALGKWINNGAKND